jgi:two-component system response regulator GlrR
VETAVEAMKAGATDFLLKPFSLEHLMQVVDKALEVRALRDENRQLKEELGRRYEFDNIIGRSQSMQEIFAAIERVGPTRATVLLTGESGVGKDLIARAIHFHSPRKDRPLVKINCSALPENLMESELFGYEKGAFTGAQMTKPGKFEQADTGTVFLDEIGDVPAPIQVKLLRVLQEREFERLGSNVTRHIDIRLVAATNADLRAALEQGTFREDLYYRLNVVTLSLPPLSARREDIPLLANHFLQRLSTKYGKRLSGFAPEALKALTTASWPGNVRQLYNVVEQVCALSSSPLIPLALVQRALRVPSVEVQTYAEAKQRFERDYLVGLLKLTDGNVADAARLADRNRTEFYRLLQKHELTPGLFKSDAGGGPGEPVAEERRS